MAEMNFSLMTGPADMPSERHEEPHQSVESLKAISGHGLSTPPRTFFITEGEEGKESPGKSAFSSSRLQTGRTGSLCLQDSVQGDGEVKLILSQIPGPIYVSVNTSIDYYKLGTKCLLWEIHI